VGHRAVRAKVHPPRLGGGKMGLFATRTPHRPNPLGLSLAKLERVRADKGGAVLLELSGVDLVDGTPVLDVKPWLPLDSPVQLRSPPEADKGGAVWRVPAWCAPDDAPPLAAVSWADAALQAAEQNAKRLRHYASAAEWRAAVAEVISFDPRAVYQGRVGSAGVCGGGGGGDDDGAAGGACEGEGYELRFDALELTFRVLPERTALVTEVR
jgi:hypothetical protein